MPALCSPHSCWSRVSVPSLKSSSSGSSTVPSHIFHLETLLHLYLLKQINYYGTERPNSWLNCWLILYRSEFTVQKPGAQIKTNNCQLIFRQQASQLISCSRSEFICCLQIFSFFIFKLIIQFFFLYNCEICQSGFLDHTDQSRAGTYECRRNTWSVPGAKTQQFNDVKVQRGLCGDCRSCDWSSVAATHFQ